MKRLSCSQSMSGLAYLLIISGPILGSLAQTLDFASSTCASTTVVSGAALSIVTAGNRASFTITARDSASIARSTGGDSFVLSLREDFDRPLGPVLDAWNGEIFPMMPMLFLNNFAPSPLISYCHMLTTDRFTHGQRSRHFCRILQIKRSSSYSRRRQCRLLRRRLAINCTCYGAHRFVHRHRRRPRSVVFGICKRSVERQAIVFVQRRPHILCLFTKRNALLDRRCPGARSLDSSV
jgi:hypothetical protein